jgi:hypothetical protein
MAIAYGAAGGNAVQAQIRYREQFPDRVVSSSKTSKKIVTEIVPSAWFN